MAHVDSLRVHIITLGFVKLCELLPYDVRRSDFVCRDIANVAGYLFVDFWNPSEISYFF